MVHIVANTLNPRPMLGERPEDQLPQIVRQFCEQLHIRWIDHTRLSWVEDLPVGECMLGPGFRRHGLLLPLGLKGKLSIEEWKVLVVSSLVRIKVQRQFLRRRGWLILFLPLLAGTIGFSIIVYTLNLARFFSAIPVTIIAYAIVLMSFVLSLNCREQRRIMVSTDRQTANLVGKDSLIKVLKKIEALQKDDPRKSGWRRFKLGWRENNIAERIANLEQRSHAIP